MTKSNLGLLLSITALLSACSSTPTAPSSPGPHLAMGLRVGEVTQTSAIVWTKLTQHPTRNNTGADGPKVVGQIGPRVILSLE
ncbi:MAG: hypothetical protein ACYTGQ_13055, partial [Planctomycetota bacterium]